MKMLATLIVLLVPTSILFAQPADLTPPVKPDGLPVAAKQAMERYDKAIGEARKAYEAAATKAADAARKELAKVQESETRSGRLESALAVKAQIDRLPASDDASGTSGLPKAYSDILSKVENGSLTETEWNTLPGVKVRIDSAGTTDTRLVVKKGEVWLIVPNPADRWQGNNTCQLVNYLGENNPKDAPYADYMRLQMLVGEVQVKGFLVEEMDGKLQARPKDHYNNDNIGAIRAKIIKAR